MPGQSVVISDERGGRTVQVEPRGNLKVTLASGDQSRVNSEGALRVVEAHDDLILDGTVFETSYWNESVAQSENVDILVRTSGDNLHIWIDPAATHDAIVHIHEDVTWSALGTQLNVINANRAVKGSGDFRAYVGPTLSASGDLIGTLLLPAGERATPIGNLGTVDYVFAASEDYLIRLTQMNSSSQMVNIRIRAHERET